MSKDDVKTEETTELRQRAEARLDSKVVRLREKASGDLERAVHELQVHQIELEMQNEELRRAQRELEASRQKYADLYDFAPIGYFTLDKNGIVTEANLTGCRMLGVERKNLINKPFNLFVARGSQNGFHKHRWAALNPGQQQTCEIALVSGDGHRFEARLDSVPVLNDDEHVVGSRVAVIDISEQKQAGAALRESEERYRTFFEGSLDAVLLTCPDGSTEEANTAACQMFQMSAEELRKAGRSGIVDRSDPRIACFLEERAQAGHFRGELNFRRKDGTVFPGEISSAVFTGAGGTARTAMIIRDITERKKAEEALWRQAQLLHLSYDAIIVWRKDGGIEHWNRGAEQLYGYTENEVLGRVTHELLKTVRSVPWPEIEAAMREHGQWEGELRHCAKDGHEVTVSARHQLVLGSDGIERILETNRDITDRKRAEEALRESERRWHDLAEALPQFVWTCTPDGPCDFLSQQWITYTGRPEAEQLGYGWLDHVHPDDRDRLKTAWDEAVASVTLFDIEFRIRRADGVYRWFKTRAIPVRDADGQVTKWFGSNTDIEDLKATTDALRLSEQRERERAAELATLLDAIPTPVFIVHDPEGDHITGNRAADELLGNPPGGEASLSAPDETRPRHYKVVKDGRELSPDELPGHRAARGEHVQDFEFNLIFDDSEQRSVIGYATPLRDDEGKPRGAVDVLIDITDRKLAEEQITNIARFPDENPFPVLRLSADGTILYSNTPGRVLLEKWNCQTSQKAPEYWCNLVRKSLRYNRNQVEQTKCGDRIYTFTMTPVRDAKYVNLYGRDITVQEQVKGFLRKSRNLLEERVSERTAELVKAVAMLEGEVEQRKRTERLLRLEEARLEALLHVTNIHEGSVNEICHFILEQGIALTNSKIGFIGFLSEDESVYTLHAVSKAIVGACDVAGNPTHWPVSSAGIWADAVRQRKTLFINDYRKAQSGKKGLPAGHIPLDRFMIVPLFEGDRIVVVAGVGNKTSNYDSSDERQMTLLLAGMWNYMQRKRGAEVLQQRTAELAKLNVELEKEIAERRRAENSLRERSRDLNALFSHTITPLAILDKEFNFVRVNKAYADSCQRDVSEFVGHNHFQFYPHEENQEIFEQVVRTKTPYEAFAKPFSFPDHPEWGVTYWDWTLVPVLDENRQVELLIFSLEDVTERVRAENEIRANQRALRELAAELQLAEERERRQIAQDLHDSIGQILAFSGRELKSLRKSLPDESAGIIEEVVEQLDTAVGQTRTLSFDLSPGILYDLGFEAAVEDLIDKMNEAGCIQCSFQSCSYPKPLADDVKILLYRSIRELLINAAKHAKADKVEVSLLRSDCDIYVKVEDDGRGFDAAILNDDLKKRRGFGLLSIRERLNHIGGSLKIESAVGKGTKAILIAPLDIEDQVERS